MVGLAERMRFFLVASLGALAILALLILAAPLHAQTAGAPINPEASAVSEQTLLQQSPRIEGRIDIPNETASVLMQPDGRVWRYFHEVLLHWMGVDRDPRHDPASWQSPI